MMTYEFEVDMVDGSEMRVKGDWRGYSFQFLRNGQVTASVGRQFFSSQDVFGIEILPGEDNIMILCAVIIIDKCVNGQQQQQQQQQQMGMGMQMGGMGQMGFGGFNF